MVCANVGFMNMHEALVLSPSPRRLLEQNPLGGKAARPSTLSGGSLWPAASFPVSPGLVPCAGEGHIGPLDATVSLVPSRPGRQDTELKDGGQPSYGQRVVPAMWVQGLYPQAGCLPRCRPLGGPRSRPDSE